MSGDRLVEFLRARLAEDEQAARDAAAANPGSAATRWSAERVDHLSSTDLRGKAWAVVPERVKGVTIAVSPTEVRPQFVAHIARHDPARVLAEVEAKRQRIEHYLEVCRLSDPVTDKHQAYVLAQGAVRKSLMFDALPYADHPGYRDEWRP